MPVVPSNTFLNANLKELEVSGSIKLGNKTITKLLDSADVSSISGSGGGGSGGIDSAATIALIDSAYVQSRQTAVGSSGTDSATVISLIDSAHVQLRQTPQDFSYSSLTGTPSLVSDFTNDANYLDSTTVTGVIDAAYIQSNQTTYDFLDSTEAIALIDSAYIQARQITYADSSYVTAQINALIDGAPGTLDTLNEIAAALNDDDSAYSTLVGLINAKSDLDSANVSSIITNNVDSAYIQLRQTTYDFLDSSEVISLIDSAYIQLRQTTYDFLDSSEVISLIDSAYVQLRQTSGGGASVTSSDSAPSSPSSGDLWFDTTDTTLYVYYVDSSSSQWISVSGDFFGLDSAGAIQLIDSAYIAARTTAGTDSAAIISLIDSAYVQARQTTYDFLDSAEAIALIDSAYISDRFPTGGSSTAILPFAFGRVISTSNASGNGISWSNWNSGSSTLDFAFNTAQPNTDYFIVTDNEFGDDINVSISSKTVNGFTASFYDDNGSNVTPNSSRPFGFIIYGSNPTQRIAGYAGNFIDSSNAIALIDSAYVQARQTTYDFLDSAEAIALIDSAYVQSRQTTYDFLDSSEAIALIDSAYVQARQTIYTNANFADSAFVTTQINNLIDGAPGTLDTLNEIAAALNDDDSAYNTLVTLIGTKSDLDSADAITLIDSAYVQARQITYDFLDSSEAINLIDSSYVQARQTTYDFLDSAETISLIDSAYIETRRPAETIFNVINSGASAYAFSGDGFPSSANNPTIYLTRGKTYKFAVNASGHPFLIRLSSGGSTYSDGVTNNGAETGNVIFTVPMDAPNTLVYQCQYHSGMVGDIKIFNEDSFLDSSDAISLVDSAYVQSRQITYDFLDSSEVISLIDSAYVQARQTSGGSTFDSAAAIELIDSAYVQARQTSGGGGGASVTSSDAAPSSPSAGDLWYDTTDGSLNIYYTDSSSSQWVNTSGTSGGAVVTISDTAPSNPASGNLWYDSLTGFMYIYYNDGSSAQWVSISGYASGGSTNSYVEATSSITALANKKYIVDTSSAITITLPAVPSFGDEVKIIDGTNNAGTNNITINRNSNKILGADSDFIIDVNRTAVDLVYYNATQGWIISGNT